MKKLKRPLSLAAAAVLCAALLTGCLSSHAQEESSSGSDASGQQTAWSEPEADQEYDAAYRQGKRALFNYYVQTEGFLAAVGHIFHRMFCKVFRR